MVEAYPVNPTSIYDDSTIQQSLGISAESLKRARKMRKLRFAKNGHRILYLGRWLIDWLESEATDQLEG